MADGDPYWSEVDRQPKILDEQTIQELNYLVSVLQGKRQSSARFRTRVKWLGLGISVIVGVTQAWDWIKGVLGHWPAP